MPPPKLRCAAASPRGVDAPACAASVVEDEPIGAELTAVETAASAAAWLAAWPGHREQPAPHFFLFALHKAHFSTAAFGRPPRFGCSTAGSAGGGSSSASCMPSPARSGGRAVSGATKARFRARAGGFPLRRQGAVRRASGHGAQRLRDIGTPCSSAISGAENLGGGASRAPWWHRRRPAPRAPRGTPEPRARPRRAPRSHRGRRRGAAVSVYLCPQLTAPKPTT